MPKIYILNKTTQRLLKSQNHALINSNNATKPPNNGGFGYNRS